MDSPSVAEQRAFAVAKLKRAASLPRMQNGRRPKMHVEAVSEGEKTPGQGSQTGEDTPDAAHTPNIARTPELEPEENHIRPPSALAQHTPPVLSHATTPEPLRHEEPASEPEPPRRIDTPRAEETDPDDGPPQAPRTPGPEREQTTTPGPEETTQQKKRRRSRSRSRGSKDLRKLRGAPSPAPTPTPANDSSPEELPAPLPTFTPFAPPLVAPTPSRLAQLGASRLVMTPEPSAFYNLPISPASPMLPSLEALRSGLIRSNSAAGRMMALNKLNGGAEPLADAPSPTRTPPAGMFLGRNNTISGGERSAARKVLLRRLGERMERNDAAVEPVRAETSAGSATEDTPSRPSTPGRRNRKRRSRRGSMGGQGVVDDRDLSSAAPDTPVPPTPQIPFVGGLSDPPRIPSTGPQSIARPSSTERERLTTLAKLMGGPVSHPPTIGTSSESVSTPRNRRSVVIEDNYDGPDSTTPTTLPTMSLHTRSVHTPDAMARSIDGAVGVPVYLAEKPSYGQDAFPTSVYTQSSPPQEKLPRDDDDEAVLFSPDAGRLQRPWQSSERDPSWIEPSFRMPVNDEEDDYEEHEVEARPVEEDDNEEPPLSAVPSEEFPPKPSQTYEMQSLASDSRELLTEREHSLEISSYAPSSSRPSGEDTQDFSQTDSALRLSEAFSSPIEPLRRSLTETELDQFSPISRSEALPSAGWENVRPVAPQMEVSTSRSKWEKVKQSFSRSNSRSGRRSRTNSVTARVEYTDSTASRESGASQVSTRGDGTTLVLPLATPPLLSPAASSASMLSLGAAPPRGGTSPIPPPSAADMLRYQNAKLFPFPGMVRLEEERARAKGALSPGLSPMASASSPDIASPTTTDSTTSLPPSSWSAATAKVSEGSNRERKLSHHASDTHLRERFRGAVSPPPLSATNSQASQMEQVSPSSYQMEGLAHSGSTHNLKQPTGMKRWLSSKKLFSSQSQHHAVAPSLGSPTYQHAPVVEISRVREEHVEVVKTRHPRKMPSLSDLLKVGGKKVDDLNDSWEEVTNESTPTTTTSGHTVGPPTQNASMTNYLSVTDDDGPSRDSSQSPEHIQTNPNGRQTPSFASAVPSSYPSPRELPYSSTTPDPLSSLEDYPTPTTSTSSSTLSSQYSNQLPSRDSPDTPSQGPVVLQRLEEMLARGPRSPMWASVIDDPPRKLVLSSPVLQVVNGNTVKDRFLFLFSDILVIAKPIMSELDAMSDTRPSPQDRKFVVKNVVHLHELRFSAERDSSSTNASTYGTPPRSAVVNTFVHQFATNPDLAISALFAKAQSHDDPVALGQLLFRANDLEKVALGDYLTRRTSRLVLKAYLDGFSFAGLRIDVALRAFLLSIAIPPRMLEYLVDSFASRWYDANADILPYNRDLAIKLCRATLQLNDALHAGVAHEPGPTPYPRRNITSSDFLHAFRKYDALKSITDDALDAVYQSVRHERLATSRHSSLDIPITMKRPLPPRITYKMQSDPVVLRIPAPDQHLTISLYGEGLTFDPPEINFARSSEASFRITGNALGAKSVLLVRSGPNASAYGGLPRAHALQVERAFMRNTFQLAFENHEGETRRYMFSLDDRVKHHQWTVSLRKHLEQATSRARTDPGAPESSRFHRAAESVAVKVLQHTLIGSPAPPAERHGRSESNAGVVGRHPGAQDGQHRGLHAPAQVETRRSRQGNSVHVRSKSRSQVYHRHGPGKFELDLDAPELPGRVTRDASEDEAMVERGPHHKLWSGGELELVCQQNSSISLVLSLLQVGSPDHHDLRGATTMVS